MNHKTPVLSDGAEQPTVLLPENFIQGVLDSFRVERQGSDYSGRELITRIELGLAGVGVAVPHLVSMAWKIAILREGMIRIDPAIFQRAIQELLASSNAMNFLSSPEVQEGLATDRGMSEITQELIWFLDPRQSAGHAGPYDAEDIVVEDVSAKVRGRMPGLPD